MHHILHFFVHLSLSHSNTVYCCDCRVWGLLAWDPKDRLTATEAMGHFYFTNQLQYTNGEENALEPQMLDPRLDMDIEKQKIDTFICPKCGRKFNDIRSCQAHTTGRRHSKFCTYDRSLLPPCLNAHSMLPSHPTSGYCDIQGRRRVIEDFHTVHLEQDHQFFGIFDGHSGNLASKYAASELYKQFVKRLRDIDEDIISGAEWKKGVENEMNESFEALHNGVLDAIQSYPAGGVMSKSGTTATALFVTKHAVIVASVGDSRAVLSVGTSYDNSNQASSIQLTFDHVAADTNERKRIEEMGGFLALRGGVLRVNGTLVLSRSIGDAHLAKFLSRTPNVVAMTKQEVKEKCKLPKENQPQQNGIEMSCFIILASDGLWDVINNQEAVDLVEKVIQRYDSIHENSWEEHGGAFQEAAEVLTQEAYVRGSTDNIGVCVVAIT
jgi:serine/threonine protein phosphatase PrpC